MSYHEELKGRELALFHFDRINRIPINSRAHPFLVPRHVPVLTTDTICVKKEGEKYRIGVAIQSYLDMPWRKKGNQEAYERVTEKHESTVLVSLDEIPDTIVNILNSPPVCKLDYQSIIIGRLGYDLANTLEFVGRITANLVEKV